MTVYALDHDKLESQQCVNIPLFAIGMRFLSLSICCANVNKNEWTNSLTQAHFLLKMERKSVKRSA